MEDCSKCWFACRLYCSAIGLLCSFLFAFMRISLRLFLPISRLRSFRLLTGSICSETVCCHDLLQGCCLKKLPIFNVIVRFPVFTLGVSRWPDGYLIAESLWRLFSDHYERYSEISLQNYLYSRSVIKASNTVFRGLLSSVVHFSYFHTYKTLDASELAG